MDVMALWQELEESLTPLLGQFRARLSDLEVSSKPDQTLLSEADIAVQEHIVSRIRAMDPTALIVAEELREAQLDESANTSSQRVWIVDPIDGTAQFVRPDQVEYCTVVCLLEDRRPVATWVLAPEIGPGRSPVCVRLAGAGQPIEVNGQPVPALPSTPPARASVTRSKTVPPRPWEQHLVDAGLELKTRTTSQTLDMVRTAVDLSTHTSPVLPPFALFYREAQKVWDGAAGMCLALAAGLHVSDRSGTPRQSIDLDFTAAEPQFASTLVTATTLPDKVGGWFAG